MHAPIIGVFGTILTLTLYAHVMFFLTWMLHMLQNINVTWFSYNFLHCGLQLMVAYSALLAIFIMERVGEVIGLTCLFAFSLIALVGVACERLVCLPFFLYWSEMKFLGLNCV